MATRWELTVNGKPFAVEVEAGHVAVDDQFVEARIVARSGNELVVEAAGQTFNVRLGDAVTLDAKPVQVTLRRLAPKLARKGGEAAARKTDVKPPMPGRIVGVSVKDGDTVQKGQVLVVLEAMKMQNEIAAPVAGVVRGLAVKQGDTIEASKVLCSIEPGA